MLTQEELDKLLEEGVDGQEDSNGQDKQPAEQGQENAQGASSSEGTVSQEELDKILAEDGGQQGGGEASSDSDGVDWSDAFAEAAAGGDPAAAKQLSEGTATPQAEPPNESDSGITASTPSFNDFSRDRAESTPPGTKPDLDFILDIPLQVSVELGRSKLQIRDLLQLGQGSVIELNKMAGEPAEIYVNQKLMAKGEVVVVNEKFGVRLTEIISPADRVKSLG